MAKVINDKDLKAARDLGSAAARRANAKPSPADDWGMLGLWDPEAAPVDKAYNWHLYQAWLGGYRDTMKELVECRHCSHRVPRSRASLKTDLCDRCYVRFYADEDEIDLCVDTLKRAKAMTK